MAQAQELKIAFTARQMTKEKYVKKLNDLQENRKPVPLGTGFLCRASDFYETEQAPVSASSADDRCLFSS